MSSVLTLALALSVLGLIGCMWYVNLILKRPPRIIPTAALTVLAALVLRAVFAQPVESKGPVNEALAVAFCYAAMVVGMVAQYGYQQAERREFTFDPAAFFMPIFASPIVFIPLLTVITDVNITGAFATPKLMVYLIAFQNGFFWRGFFEGLKAHGVGLRGSLAPDEHSESTVVRRV